MSMRDTSVHVRLLVLAALLAGCGPSPAPPVPVGDVLLGADAYARWDLWPRLRLGTRAYMRSTYDRTGGNDHADASHFLREDDPDHSVSLDVAGTGVLSFVRTNHWHGSPWHYLTDGTERIVQDSATANPASPPPTITFVPADAFPSPVALTYPATAGADLSWVPIPFTSSLELAYGRTFYGTGYYIYTLVAPDVKTLTPIASWDASPPADAIGALLSSVGQDLAPFGTAQSGQLQLQAGSTVDLASLDSTATPATAIRLIRLSASTADAIALGRVRLQITWDGLPGPSVDAPVSLLYGTGSLFNRDQREFLVKSLPATVRFDAGAGTVELSLYFPMPFYQHAAVRLVAADAVSKLAWEIRTAPYPDPPSQTGYFHANYVDHGTPVPGQDLVLLDTTTVEGGGDWCGHLVGTSFIFSDAANLGTLEGDPRFFFDDSGTPQAQGTGTEEWGGGGDYWEGGRTTTLPLAGHPVGAPSAAAALSQEDLIHSAYRYLLADAMPFGKNARIQLEHGGVDDSTEHYQSVTLWYARPSACLRLTDSLHVSDPADEAAHHYASPTASTPLTVTSRYEVGVDHVGTVEVVPATTDTGRSMSDTTELRMALDPDNVGALLRRKLDYAFADQRAEVFVSDDADGAQFVHVGTWYLAGSNSFDTSFPAGELSPPAPMVQTSNRQWRDDELLLPASSTAGRSSVRIRIQFVPGARPIVPGAAPPPSAWSEYRYSIYSYVRPQ
jgi:hypothetical protein